jgi:hypothetical protein
MTLVDYGPMVIFERCWWFSAIQDRLALKK